MSRLYNDMCSLMRDRAEGNVNCADFAELTNGKELVEGEDQVKKRLVMLAQYEREAGYWVGTKLINRLRNGEGREMKRKADAVSLFLGVAELYADIYVVRDLSNRLDDELAEKQGPYVGFD